MSTSRIYSFDLLRFIAITMVFLCHFSAGYNYYPVARLLAMPLSNIFLLDLFIAFGISLLLAFLLKKIALSIQIINFKN
jgi:surface polysaccharide O-acyltransferase-like enzyme